MFPVRFFPERMFALRFFPKIGGELDVEGIYFPSRFFTTRMFAPRFFPGNPSVAIPPIPSTGKIIFVSGRPALHIGGIIYENL